MLPLLLLAGGGLLMFALAGGAKAEAWKKDLERLKASKPEAAAAVETALAAGGPPNVLMSYAAQLNPEYPILASHLADVAKGEATAPASEVTRAVSDALASGRSDVMRSAAAQLSQMGYPQAAQQLLAAAAKAEQTPPASTSVAQTVQPEMSGDLADQFNRLLATEGRPEVLEHFAAILEGQGYGAAATALRDKVDSIKMQTEVTEAMKATQQVLDPGWRDESGTTTSPGINPTTSAMTAKKSAETVNAVAEAIAKPSAESVAKVTEAAATLAKSAPVEVKEAAVEVIEKATAAAAAPSADTLAAVAKASTELAQAAATPENAAATAAAVEEATKLVVNPSPAQASTTSTTTSQVAEKTIDLAKLPIKPPGTTTYTVQAGDSPWSIAEKLTGNGHNHKELFASNPQKETFVNEKGQTNFVSLSKGEVIVLPERWVSLAPETTVRAEVTTAAPTAPVTVSTEPIKVTDHLQVPTAPATYTVLKGDYAFRIAQKLTGDGNRWRELRDANPEKPRQNNGNFKTLFPGEVLKLPDSWVTKTAVSGAPWPRPAQSLGDMGLYPTAA